LLSIARAARRGLAVLGAVALVTAGAACFSARAQAFVFRMSVSRAQQGRPITSNFLGLALEYSALPGEAGADSKSINPVLVQLIRNLVPDGRPVVRVGGLSTDRTWWPAVGLNKPLGVTYGLSTRWTNSARALAQATNAQLILGLNLQANRPAVDAVEANQLLNGIGRQYIDALEIGNEAELYTSIPWYKTLNGKLVPWYWKTGTPVYARPPCYGASAFVGDFKRALHAVPSGVPIAGPATGLGTWLSVFHQLLSRRSRVRLVTWHAYGLNQCVTDPTSPQYPSVPNLLSLGSSRGFVNGLAPFVGWAHGVGAGFRVDEMNSVTCNGRAGVSNTMASALWVMDALFTLAADGVDGVNIHTYPGAANGLFDFSSSHGQWEGTVHPPYYGTLMFGQAAPAGSHLLVIHSPAQKTVRAWATRGLDHRVRVLLINDSLTSSGVAVVRPAGVTSPAALERLRASSAYATGGLTLGGESFGSQTATGLLPAPEPQTIAERSGSYSVQLPAASAALLTFAPS
jgi:hypothetical protein